MGKKSIAVALLALVGAVALAGWPRPKDSTTPAPPAAPAPVPPPTDHALGSTGLDIRYLDTDGTLKTLRVRDFPR